MPTLQRPDAAIHYEVTGSGPALVFLHGLGGNHLSWWQQVPHFAARHTCVTLSHRGFAPSSVSAAGAGASAYADDLAALIDHLKLDSVSLVCQSMGGWTGLEYALAKPGRVRAAVFACTSGTVDYTKLDGVDLAAWSAQSALALKDLTARGISPAGGERLAREQPAMHHLYASITALTPAAWRERIGREIRALRLRAPQDLANLEMPVLWLVGEEDVVFPPDVAPALAAIPPRAIAMRVREAGHSVYFERAPEFNRAVDELLALA
jgi:3-oxoadipate enol-lactonase